MYLIFRINQEKMLNHSLFQEIKNSRKKILLVTKYWNEEITQKIWIEARQSYRKIIFGIGENRIENIRNKNIPREDMHFIGNIQSQKIPEVVKHCSTIHSLSSIKHAQKIERTGKQIKAFIQIKLDGNKNIGIPKTELGDFLETCENFKNLKIIGISGMGSRECYEQEKRDEFQTLISLRDAHLPHGLISAGTSRDYKIALEQGIDIVRIGTKSIM